MKDNFIGFRLDFSNAKPEDIKIWLNKYLEEFGRYEIKTTKSFISSV